MCRSHRTALFLSALVTLAGPVLSAQASEKRNPSPLAAPTKASLGAAAEARLVAIYRLIGNSQARQALPLAEQLVKDHPDFQLAQLTYGDLLLAQTRTIRLPGDMGEAGGFESATADLAGLRQEAIQRLRARAQRPPPGTVPSQFLALSANSKHAIAVDASRSRLYLFKNSPLGLQLVEDFYVSVGSSGIFKQIEGDARTPLGVYFITSTLDPTSLPDFYGSGALPLNYPNPLDLKRGKSGSGIWLHGTPPGQFARAPMATEGCLALSNPDLEQLIRTVAVRSTPVVIAHSLTWVAPQSLRGDSQHFEAALQNWRQAKSSGNMSALDAFYAPDFTSRGRTRSDWMRSTQVEVQRLRGREIELKDVSYLRWTDSADTMVVTFGELIRGDRSGRTKRQYWIRQNDQWKIFFEGLI